MNGDLFTYIWSGIQQILTEYAYILFELLPKTFGAIVILLLGWILGRIFGRLLS